MKTQKKAVHRANETAKKTTKQHYLNRPLHMQGIISPIADAIKNNPHKILKHIHGVIKNDIQTKALDRQNPPSLSTKLKNCH